MGESQLHVDLVSCLELWIRKCQFLGNNHTIYVDRTPIFPQDLPPLVASYRPDIYGHNKQMGRVVIGEAKTPKDLDSTRSRNQIEAFLREVSLSPNYAFVLGTRWDYVRYANSVLKYICVSLNGHYPNYAVIDQFGNIATSTNDWI